MAAIHASIISLEWLNTLDRRTRDHTRVKTARVTALNKIKERIINGGYSTDELKHLAEVVSNCEHSFEFFTKNKCYIQNYINKGFNG